MSSYVEESLLKNEKVLFQAQMHWIVFLPTIIWLLMSLVLYFLGSEFRVFSAFFSIIMFASFLSNYINYKTSEFALTNRRIILKIGFIRRHTLELFLTRLEGMFVNQSIMGRLLNFGTLVVVGTGGTRDAFYKISDPLAFRRRVLEEVDALESPPQG